MITADVLQNSVNAATFERRRFQRLRRAVQTELRMQGSKMPIRAETTDISMGGCYIEMAVTIEIGTALNLVLWLGHKKLMIDGVVVTRHSHFGNGIEFGKMAEDARRKLQAFIDSADVVPKETEVTGFVEGLIV